MSVSQSSEQFPQCLATLVAAPASGQGKTLFCAALARSWLRQGKRVQVFKIGPDYLDPTILEQASGQPVYNLDLWVMGERHCRALLARAAADNDIILIESLMGLHDNHPSNARLARLFNLPVTLILNVAKFAQTAAAIVEGMRDYDVGADINAVVGNLVGSDNHHLLMCEAIGDLYAGSMRRDPRMELPERHLGLVQASDLEDLDNKLNLAAKALEEFEISIAFSPIDFAGQTEEELPALLENKTIAIARDAAFSFIYPMNIEMLEKLGAELVYFSPLANDVLPDCDALWLPGGYPELHLQALTSAAKTRSSIVAHHQSQKPILAECGGMMYLTNSITDVDGESATGCALFDAQCYMHKRFQSVGLQSVNYESGQIRGHSFHHSKLETNVAPSIFGVRQNGGEGEAVYQISNLTMGYMHHYFSSNPEATAKLFV